MKNSHKLLVILSIVSSFVLIMALSALIFTDELSFRLNYEVIGIRIAAIIISFAAFCADVAFSLLVYMHNRTASRINDDANKRAETFRNLQFSSTNYSIIEFMDRMLIYKESVRYIDKFIRKRNTEFHMFDIRIDPNDVFDNPDKYTYLSVKIPFKVIEGKLVSKIMFDRLKFEREDTDYVFVAPFEEVSSRAYILYNEYTKRNNVIVNLIVEKDSSFFNPEIINVFSKIKIKLNITSLLNVKVDGISELYFINPQQIEGDGTNTYKINSSNFVLQGMPSIELEEGII